MEANTLVDDHETAVLVHSTRNDRLFDIGKAQLGIFPMLLDCASQRLALPAQTSTLAVLHLCSAAAPHL